jgi:acetyl-CoA carboxylase carboxyl transferase subunit beta
MSLQQWFANRRQQQGTQARKLNPDGVNRIPDATMKALWHTCFQCGTQLVKKDLVANAQVCPVCGYHDRIGARERIAQLTTRFVEWDAELAPADPLDFADTQPYRKRQAEAQAKTSLNDAIITGIGWVDEEPLALAVMDFNFMGGSMGAVVGERITRAVERAIEADLPVLVVTSSGGARMQEGMFSLMQMVKTSAALSRLHERGLLYMTLLTEPTFGGVTASYGTLGDVILAEQGARIGFAGRRVIEQTIRQKLPDDFQTADYLLRYGQVDRVCHRHALPTEIAQLLRLHRRASQRHPNDVALAQWEGEAKPFAPLPTAVVPA